MSVASYKKFCVKPDGKLTGRLRVPGDKSISHRSIMLGALADGITRIRGFLEGEDSLNTLRAFQAMGVPIEGPIEGEVIIQGVGIDGLKEPLEALYVGNSGTSMRLLSGILAAQPFASTLTGDESLTARPMKRVIDPLKQMGANIKGSQDDRPPLLIQPVPRLKSMTYEMPVASAQVKSCLLLAGLFAEGETVVIEPQSGLTRDHTERMLTGFGYEVTSQGAHISLRGGQRLTATTIDVPADLSSAAFFLVGASIAPGSDIVLEHVGVNPTRTGVLDILKLMGADITLFNQREVGGEPVADIRVRHANLKGITVPEHLVPLAIDEFPAIFVAAACASGEFVLTGGEELRVKETDRIAAMAEGLQTLGIDAKPTADGMKIQGGKISSGTVASHGDHRIAMAFTMASLRASGPIEVNDCDNVATSFPNFVELARTAGLNIDAS